MEGQLINTEWRACVPLAGSMDKTLMLLPAKRITWGMISTNHLFLRSKDDVFS